MFLLIILNIILQVGRLPPTFLDAAKLANAILNLGYDFTDGKIIYNKFKSVVSYSISDIPFFNLSVIEVILFNII